MKNVMKTFKIPEFLIKFIFKNVKDFIRLPYI